MKKLAVIGAGGHGKVVADTASLLGWSDILFFDAAWPQKVVAGPWQILGTPESLFKRAAEFDGVIIAIGDNQTRLKIFSDSKNSSLDLITLKHPNSVVSPNATVGRGSVVFAGVVINIGAVLGECVIVNTGAIVDHDCILENGVHIAPGAHLSGNVHVGPGTWVGVGACVKQGIKIGANVTVGAGAVVISDIADGLTVLGNPARPKC